MSINAIDIRKTRIFPSLFFIVLLLGIDNLYGRYFPNAFGLLGHDFALANPSLLDGAYWFWNNSILDVPWFTPSFCGGQPFFADPQSIYYSPLQWLTFFLPPTQASHIALLLGLSMGYWSFYFLFRYVFHGSVRASIIAGALAMLNGFVPYRLLLGEVGYQPFLLTGFVAHALLTPNQWQPLARAKSGLGNIFWAGLTIALMLQAGLTTLMIPAAFGVLVLALIARLGHHGIPLTTFFLRSVQACIFAGAICASKILASTTFMSHFPRESYSLPGFPHLVDALRFPLYSLVLQSQTVWNMATPRLANAQWTVYPHEWAYQFGLIYLLLLLAGLYFFGNRISLNTTKNISTPTSTTSRNSLPHIIFLVMLITVILLIPSAILWYTPEWNAILKFIPIIKTTSFPFRWIIIWIPPGCIVGAMAWQSVEQKLNTRRDASPEKEAWLLVILFLVAMLIESGLADKEYYITPYIQTYDPRPVDQAWLQGKNGYIPPISRIIDDDQPMEVANTNETIIVGASFLHCYNPTYGYRQETLPVGRLRAGMPTMSVIDNHLNIKNPACLIWPIENACNVIGDEYKSSDAEEATRFIHRKSLTFNMSKQQELANQISKISVLVALAGIFFSLIAGLRHLKNLLTAQI